MSRLSGIICPLLTPFEADGRIARDLWVAHARWVLDQGAHYLSPFGTTGEALSVGMQARKEALNWLIEDGIPADRLLPGTGLTALADTTDLSRHAMQSGCAGVMVLPSFFYGAVGDAGQARYFLALSDAIAGAPIILYNIPQNSSVAVSPTLAAQLAEERPESFVAYKDSSGNWANTEAVIKAAPTLSVFPGSESFLTQGLAAGAAGCISATVNLNAAAIRAVFDHCQPGARDQDQTPAPDEMIKTFRATVQSAGLIGAMKAVLAVTLNDPRWLNLLPPHQNATLAEGRTLLAELGPLAAHMTG